MRKRVDKLKKAALMVAFAGFLSVPSLPVLAAGPEDAVTGSTEAVIVDEEGSTAVVDDTDVLDKQDDQDKKVDVKNVKDVKDKKDVKTEKGGDSVQDVALVEDGWHYEYEGGEYIGRYYMNGEYLKNTVKTIDGSTYGFKKNGAAEYIYSSYGLTCFDSGEFLFFVNKGKLVAKKERKDGFVAAKVDGETKKVYVKNNKLVTSQVIKIGSDLYAFDGDGIMRSDESFSIFDHYDEKTQQSIYYYYHAKPSGKLCVNMWYKRDDYSSKYYYGADGKAATGLKKIGKKTYLFSDSGGLMINEGRKIGSNWYVGNDDGIATNIGSKDGKKKVGNNTYYIKNGEMLKRQVVKLGSAYYGFNYNGVMYDDQSFDFYDYDTNKSNYYRAKPGGKLYVNAWATVYGYDEVEKYYYGAKGVAARDLTTIGKKNYYFDYNGRMFKDTSLTASNGKPYAVSKTGVCKLIKNNQFTTVDGYKYYAVGGKMLTSTVRKIGKAYYGFDYNGRMYDNKQFSASDEKGNYGYFRAKVGGKLYRNAWFRKYYYGADGRAKEGLQKIGKKTYYFPYEGAAAITNEYAEVDGKFYHADKTGKLTRVKKTGLYYENPERTAIVYLQNKVPLKKKWKKVGKFKYYFNEDGYAYRNGVYKINGKYYSFRNDGTLQTNEWVDFGSYERAFGYASKTGALVTGTKKIGKKKYSFDSQGYMQTGVVSKKSGNFVFGRDGAYVGKLKKTGWTKLKGITYYAKNNVPAEGLTKIGKAYYYFSNGQMLTSYRGYNEDAKGNTGYYIFKSNGKRVESGWYYLNNEWYYVDPTTHMTTRNETKIGKKTYRFDWDGEAQVKDYADTYNKKLYTIGKKGQITKTSKLGNGWTLFGGNYYYYKNGRPYTGWVSNCFVKEGRMLTNTVTPDNYYVGKTGKIVKKTGWIMTIDTLTGTTISSGRYIKKGGKVAKDEWLTINKKKYHFSSEGYSTTGLAQVDGSWYLFDTDGALLKKLGKNPKEGSFKAKGNTYFIKNGTPADGNENIGTKTYYFYYGRMAKNEMAGGWYGSSSFAYNKAGAAATKFAGWKKVNGVWFYFLKDGKAPFGWITVKGARYYIDSYAGMVTGYKLIDGVLYQFNKKGKLVKTITKKADGWFKAGGKYYYYSQGRFVTGLFTIKGKTYMFDYDGTLVINGYCDGYYTNKSGVILRNVFKVVDGEKRYFGADGFVYNGIWKIKGKVYYFN